MTESVSTFSAATSKLTFYAVLMLAISLLLGRGLYALALVTILLGVLGQGVSGNGVHLSRSLKLLLILGVILFVQGIAVATVAYDISPYPILWCLITATGIWCLPGRASGQVVNFQVIGLILVLFVFANLTFNAFWTHWPRDGKVGLFSNVHYMSMYCVMTFPILMYAITNAPSLRVRWFMSLTLLGDVWLLLETHSRPGYLAVMFSALVVIPFMAPHLRWRLGTLTASIPILLYLGNVAGFSARVDDFADHFAQDERWEIWVEAIRLQMQSTGLHWLRGHGIGAFHHDFRAFALSLGMGTYLSQHNFFMEILYSHGVIGLIVVTLAYGFFIYRLARITWFDNYLPSRRIGLLLLSVATAQWVHGFSTVPFFSRDYLLPLGFVLGAGFLYAEKSNRAL
jgi:hypothetical protein